MTIIVVGATGATGRLLVEQLLSRGYSVWVVVRSADKLSDAVKNHPRLSVTEAAILDLTNAKLAEVVHGCAAVACCLGHTLNWNGIFGAPHRLVTDATRRLCMAIQANTAAAPTKYVLMNSAGVSNRDVCEPLSLAQRCVIGLVRLLVPPHADNEQAADFLRTGIGQHDSAIEWVAVRPDTLTDEDTVSEYAAYPSPTRSGVFNPGATSRINVAYFMAELLTSEDTWSQWKGQMPVIYNVTP
jgi:NAD(P)-dependent dehydrogenase (short-subunit alcohol dehydrogenase family)